MNQCSSYVLLEFFSFAAVMKQMELTPVSVDNTSD